MSTIFIPGLKKPVPVDILHRFAARLLDIAISIFIASLIVYPIGPLLSFIYIICADAIKVDKQHSASIGKYLLKLHVIQSSTQQPIDIKSSMIRNLTFGFANVCLLIPFWGWIIFGIIVIPMSIFEIVLILRSPDQKRLGDLIAQTSVVWIDSQ
jgi:uncharacterized RDD family membrane protein YckC